MMPMDVPGGRGCVSIDKLYLGGYENAGVEIKMCLVGESYIFSSDPSKLLDPSTYKPIYSLVGSRTCKMINGVPFKCHLALPDSAQAPPTRAVPFVTSYVISNPFHVFP